MTLAQSFSFPLLTHEFYMITSASLSSDYQTAYLPNNEQVN
jgi:hypothetical protein